MRRVLQFASLACLATLCLFYPVIESLDAIDPQIPASDLEIEIIVLLTFLGIVFVLAHLIASVAISAVMSVFRLVGDAVSSRLHVSDFAIHPFLSPSPPLPLRI